MARSLDVQVRELARAHGVEQVELRRSDRRRRTVSAFRENGTLIIAAPNRISAAELLELADDLLRRVIAKERAHSTDAELHKKASALAAAYLPANLPPPVSVRWTDARSTWGSCVSADRTIVISRALLGMPDWVVDYVVVHELAHLLEANHGPRFYELVARYPQWEQARAFLDGVTWQARMSAGVPRLSDVDSDADVAETGSGSGDALRGHTGSSQSDIQPAHTPPRQAPPLISTGAVPQPADLFEGASD